MSIQQVIKHLPFYGDWNTLEWVFRYSMERTLNDGFMDIIGNLVECSAFHKFIKKYRFHFFLW